MNRTFCFVLGVAVFGLLAAAGRAGDLWETDFEKASQAAKSSNRYMLLDFSGSDWCGWCMKLDEQVFSKKAFKEYADKNLVCVLLDFPHGKKLKASLKEQNDGMAKKYGVRGFPSVILLAPDGSLAGRTGYQDGGADKYVEHLKGFIDPHRAKNNVPEPAAISTGREQTTVRPSLRTEAPKMIPRDENREQRTWTSRSGATLTASLVEERASGVVLKKDDGSQVQILQSQLSAEDQKYISELKAASQGTNAPPSRLTDRLPKP